ncbi:MAG TPA: folylpolyglutamate synthase/dihydrofolate synthase family protein [Thermoplasmata archaeon]|nr:folylpolyglutamate synthase/dihydrofolate synthase family protein [Thermoplasmata archaeon]
MSTDAYRATLGELFRRRRFGIRPGLDVISALLEALGAPQRSFPAVHVTGSKGKGSVSAMTQAILSAHGLRTGLFISPHLASYRERIQIDGRLISPADVVRGLDRILGAERTLHRERRIERDATFFECTTALAFDHFARAHVDAAVIEVGIGGRWDATNVLGSRVGVITTLELEHTEILGPTIAAIAREKSGIFHAGMTGVLGDLPAEGRAVIEAFASEKAVALWHLGREVRVENRELRPEGQTLDVHIPAVTLPGVRIPLLGRFQPANAALAIAAAARFLESSSTRMDGASVRKGLRSIHWRGRMERIARRPDVYLDVAHTPESIRAVAQSLAEIDPAMDAMDNAIVFGCLLGKDAGTMLSTLSDLARTLVLVPVASERGIAPAALKVFAAGRFPIVVIAPSASEGLRLARAAASRDGFVLVTGSDYLVGDLLRSLQGDASEEPDLSDPGQGPPPALGNSASPSLADGRTR